jgi:hypothetical protein
MELNSRLRYSVLPAMPPNLQGISTRHPPSGHKSHQNVLSVRPETWRRLENIYSLKEASMDQTITSCKPGFCFPFADQNGTKILGIDAIIPEGSSDLPLTIPCLTDPRFSPLEVTRKPPRSIAGYDKGYLCMECTLTETSG